MSENPITGEQTKLAKRQKRVAGTSLISLKPALVEHSFCPGRENGAMYKPEVQIGTSSLNLACASGNPLLAFFLLLVLILFVQNLWGQEDSSSMAPMVSSESGQTGSPDTQSTQQTSAQEQYRDIQHWRRYEAIRCEEREPEYGVREPRRSVR